MSKISFSRLRVMTVLALMGIGCSALPLWAQQNPATPHITSGITRSGGPSADDTALFGRSYPPLTGPGLMGVTQLGENKFRVPVSNIKASLMAYWLDPLHNPVPRELQLSHAMAGDGDILGTLPRLPGNGNGPVGLKLPEGVTSVEPIDPQNSLIVTGTKEGVKALAALLPTIDVPLVQCEIEAQFLSVSRADLSELGLDFGKPVEQGPYSFGAIAMAGNIQSPITKLIAQGRVKVLTAPRVTAIDGLTATLQQTTFIPFTLALPPGLRADGEEAGTKPNIAYLTTSIGLRARPTRIKDDQFSLSVTPTFVTRSLSATVTVRDGQAFAIQMSPATDDNQIIVIVTTRLIHRLP